MSGLRGVCNQCFTFVPSNTYNEIHFMFFLFFFFLCCIFIYTSPPLSPFHFPLISQLDPYKFRDDSITLSFPVRNERETKSSRKNIYIYRKDLASHDFELNFLWYNLFAR